MYFQDVKKVIHLLEEFKFRCVKILVDFAAPIIFKLRIILLLNPHIKA